MICLVRLSYIKRSRLSNPLPQCLPWHLLNVWQVMNVRTALCRGMCGIYHTYQTVLGGRDDTGQWGMFAFFQPCSIQGCQPMALRSAECQQAMNCQYCFVQRHVRHLSHLSSCIRRQGRSRPVADARLLLAVLSLFRVANPWFLGSLNAAGHKVSVLLCVQACAASITPINLYQEAGKIQASGGCVPSFSLLALFRVQLLPMVLRPAECQQAMKYQHCFRLRDVRHLSHASTCIRREGRSRPVGDARLLLAMLALFREVTYGSYFLGLLNASRP